MVDGGMSSRSRGVSSLSTFEAMSSMGLLSLKGWAWNFLVLMEFWGLLAEFRSRVIRLICLVSYLLIGVWIL